jgi:ERCC4-type nuclease
MSKKDFDTILKSFKLIVDTRENQNSHITNIFKKHNIQIVYDKLEFADYSCICCDYDFRNDIVVERKMNIDEFCNNITRKRIQFENELNRSAENNTKFQLIIEETSYIDILNEAYRSKTKQQSIVATLNTN